MGAALSQSCMPQEAPASPTVSVPSSPTSGAATALPALAVAGGTQNVPTAGSIAASLAGDEDPSACARQLAYLHRKERIQARRLRTSSRGSLNREDFLSSLHEVEADVRYRFTFALVGPRAEYAAEAACESWAARALQRNGDQVPSTASSPEPRSRMPSLDEASPTNRRTSTSSSLKSPLASYRCLCPVVLPPKCEEGSEQRPLAKLVLRPLRPGEDIPLCDSRAEALSSVVAFVLSIDAQPAEEGTFEEQLEFLALTVEQMRSRGKASLRPVRALILCQSEADGRSEGGDQWAASLSDFERAQGDLWKFGPVSLQDGDALHTIFSEIASVRIAKTLMDGTCPSAGPREPEEVEEDGEDLPLPAGLQEPVNTHLPRADSGRSEGWQRPPVFEAECDGSECGEAALELHTRLFGARYAGTPGSSTTSEALLCK